MKTSTVLLHISIFLAVTFLPFILLYCWTNNILVSLINNAILFYSCVVVVFISVTILLLYLKKIIFFYILFFIFLFILPSFDAMQSCNLDTIEKYARNYDFALVRYISTNIRDNCRIDCFFSSKDKQLKKSNFKITVVITNPSLKTQNTFFIFALDDIESALINNQVLYTSKAYSLYIKKSWIDSLKVKYRTLCFNTIFNKFSMLSASIFFAIAHGDKSFINKRVYNTFIKTGTAHLLALSGMHLSLLLLIISFFSKNTFFYIITSLCFVIITGMNTSLIRAFFTLFFGLLPLEKKFRINYIHFPIFIIYATYILLPYAIVTASFLLSISAIYGIFFAMHFFKLFKKKISFVLKATLMSFCVTVFQLPFILYYFKSIPLFSWLYNVLAIPLFSVTTHFGLLSFIINPYNIYCSIAEYFLYSFVYITTQFNKISLDYACNLTNNIFLIVYTSILISLYYILCSCRKHSKNNIR